MVVLDKIRLSLVSLGSKRPYFEIALPPPITVSTLHLILAYAALISLDYLLLRNHRHFPISKSWLHLLMVAVHIGVPLTFETQCQINNFFLIICPWFFVACATQMTDDGLGWYDFLRLLHVMVLDIRNSSRQYLMTHLGREGVTCGLPKDKRAVRLAGLVKLGRGALKMAFVLSVVDRFLPSNGDYTFLLATPWCSTASLGWTLLIGFKGYALLGGLVDMITGVEQAVSGIALLDLFYWPMLAHSVVDFWSRRWNRFVRNILHHLFFEERPINGKTPPKTQQQWWQRQRRGLVVFGVSGIFHELIIMGLLRRATLENLLFFWLHGVAASLQVYLRHRYGILKQEPQGLFRLLCIALHLCFLSLTGRLFLAPYIRYALLQPLPPT